MEISLKSDIKRLSYDLNKIKSSAIPQATTQALNKTVKGVQSDLTKMLSKVTGINQNIVRDDLKITKANKVSQTAKVDSSKGRAKNLINFVSKVHKKPNHFNEKVGKGKRRRYRAKGVKANAWRNLKTYNSTFIGTGKNGATLVFKRGKGTTKYDKGRLESISGPSIRQEFQRQYTKAFMQSKAKQRFSIEMARAVKFQLSKIK
jgi:hypothetical protein